MGQSRSAAAVRRIVLVHVRHVVYRDASGLTATPCTGHGRFGARRTRNKRADAAKSVDADLRDHVLVLWERARVGADAMTDREGSRTQSIRETEGANGGPKFLFYCDVCRLTRRVPRLRGAFIIASTPCFCVLWCWGDHKSTTMSATYYIGGS